MWHKYILLYQCSGLIRKSNNCVKVLNSFVVVFSCGCGQNHTHTQLCLSDQILALWSSICGLSFEKAPGYGYVYKPVYTQIHNVNTC